jgi:hypothetical protein
MSTDAAIQLVCLLVALQFAAFGWRIIREIAVEDAGRRTWLPVPDILNIFSMASVVLFSIILPFKTNQFGMTSKAVLVVGYVLIVFHPVSMAAHYRLWSGTGRTIYKDDYPRMTGQEMFSVALSVVLAALSGCYILR